MVGRQWNLMNVDLPARSTSRKVWIPNPSIIRNERGIARSDMTQTSMCMLSGINEAKSQKVSCADPACGKPRSGSIFTEWIRSGNLIASWMKKTGILLPTRSKLPSFGVKLDREAANVARQVARAGPSRHRQKRAETLVFLPGSCRKAALVRCDSDFVG